MHTISAKTTPKSSANACRGPRERLVSTKRKKTGPMNTKLSIKPKPTAEKISSIIGCEFLIETPKIRILFLDKNHYICSAFLKLVKNEKIFLYSSRRSDDDFVQQR